MGRGSGGLQRRVRDLGGLEEKNLPTTSLFIHSTVSGALEEGLSMSCTGSQGPVVCFPNAHLLTTSL